MDHQITVPGFDSMKDLATTVGNLRYDALHEFLFELHNKLADDAKADSDRNRPQLAASLFEASLDVGQSAKHIGDAWKHSEPFMPKHDIYDQSDMD